MKPVLKIILAYALLFVLGTSVCVNGQRAANSVRPTGVSDSAKAPAAANPQIPVCSVCGKACTGRYVKVRGEVFCSEECLKKKYFCSGCGVTLGTRTNPAFSTMVDVNEKPIFFCQECMKKTGCSFCGSRKETISLKDGRTICSTCRESAIFKTEDAEPIQEAAQKMLHEYFDYPIRSISLEVLSRDEFRKQTEGSRATPNALAFHLAHFSGKTQLSDDGKLLQIEMDELDSRMIVLEGSPAALVFDSIAHELSHEFLRRKFYHFEDPVIEEGFCEAIAAACSILNGHPSFAERRITNPDPIYGEGFRKIYSMLQDEGWDAAMKFLKANSQPMEEYVKNHLDEVLDAESAQFLKGKNVKPKLKFGPIQ